MKNLDTIKKMSLEEKASLTSGKNFWETKNIDHLDIPSIFLADGPHGIRRQEAAADHLGLNESLKATCFPTAVSLANTWNSDLVEKVGIALGIEAKHQKVNVLLGPGTNIKRNPLCGRNFEYFSEDPYLAGIMASSLIKGIQANGVSACVKHFAANNQEERRMVIDTIVDERTLREIYLTPFEMAVKQGKTKAIMSSYNKLNGTYTNEHEHLLRNILRNEWGFNGVVVTDWGGNNDRIKALKAGNELEMPGNGGDTDREIIDAINKGELEEKYLDEAVDRLITLIQETNSEIKNKPVNFDAKKHHEFARKVAAESIVLLKNKDNVLPLKNKEKVVIIGDFAKKPRYQGAGSSIVNPTFLDNTLDVIREYNLEFLGYEPGFKRYGKKSKRLINKALKLSEKANTILLYVGLDEITEVEGLDRINMKLPSNQIELIHALAKTGKKIILVISCGSAIEINFDDKVDAIVHGHLLGQAGSRALLDVITGKISPSGRLSETLPQKYSDVPSSPYFPGKEISVEYRESIYVGYRYYDKIKMDVKYPFGFGLSYSDFEYSNLKVNNKGVTFDLKNIGDYPASEVCQLYIGKKDSNIFRSEKELKGFKKVELLPNETKKIEISFNEYTFRYWNVKTNKYEVEAGDYQIYICKHVNQIELKGELNIEGTTDVLPYDLEKLPSYQKGDIKNISLNEFETLLGDKVPNPNRSFVKKNRIHVSYNTTVAELRYAKGWTGRLFSFGIRMAPKLLRSLGKKQLANTIHMGLYHQPMRGISRMTNGAISWGQLEGLLIMFNGKFFKGLKRFFKEGKIKKQRNKKLKKQNVIL